MNNTIYKHASPITVIRGHKCNAGSDVIRNLAASCHVASLLITIGITSPLYGNERLRSSTTAAVVFSGPVSQIDVPMCMRLESPEEFEKCWLKHLKTARSNEFRQRFNIDFRKYLAIGIFLGSKDHVRGIKVDEVLEDSSHVTVRFTRLAFQTTTELNSHSSTYAPYAFVVLPKTEKQIVLESNEQNLLGAQPKWRTYARLTKTPAPVPPGKSIRVIGKP